MENNNAKYKTPVSKSKSYWRYNIKKYIRILFFNDSNALALAAAVKPKFYGKPSSDNLNSK